MKIRHLSVNIQNREENKETNTDITYVILVPLCIKVPYTSLTRTMKSSFWKT